MDAGGGVWSNRSRRGKLAGGDARSKGTDAIRCVLIFKNPKTGRRVATAGVIERTLLRAREAYAEGNRRARSSS